MGFKIARTEYILEFQSDIYINQKRFEKNMISSIEKFKLSSISGRHVHYFSMLEEGKKVWLKYPFIKMKFSLNLIEEGVGLIGEKIFQNINSDISSNYIYVGETVSRGPWLLKKSLLEKVNYLDQENYFLGNDDHDFHFRVRKLVNLDIAYLPINIFSNRLEGSTRKKRDGINAEIFNYLNQNKTGSDEFKNFMKHYKPFKKIEKIEL